VARISAEIDGPGVIKHHSPFAIIEFGELDGRSSERLERFLSVAREAGIDAELRDDIDVAIWEKFVLLASFSAVTTLTRLAAGPIRDNTQTWQLMEAAARETGAVARARGIPITQSTVDDIVEMIGKLPDGMKSSMLVDLERGNRLELEWLSGTVCRLGREAGVDTSVHRVVLAALLPYANGSLEGG
jgi:2-dehydropantoate 2-reductase